MTETGGIRLSARLGYLAIAFWVLVGFSCKPNGEKDDQKPQTVVVSQDAVREEPVDPSPEMADSILARVLRASDPTAEADSTMLDLILADGNALVDERAKVYGAPGMMQYFPGDKGDSGIVVTAKWIPKTQEAQAAEMVFRFRQAKLSKSDYHLYYPTVDDIRNMHGRMTKDVCQKHKDAQVEVNLVVTLDHFPKHGVFATCKGNLTAFGKDVAMDRHFNVADAGSRCDEYEAGRICWTISEWRR